MYSPAILDVYDQVMAEQTYTKSAASSPTSSRSSSFYTSGSASRRPSTPRTALQDVRASFSSIASLRHARAETTVSG